MHSSTCTGSSLNESFKTIPVYCTFRYFNAFTLSECSIRMLALPVRRARAEGSQPCQPQNLDYLQGRTLQKHFHCTENPITLVWATAAQGESTYGLTYRCRESLQCCCATEDSLEITLQWAGAGKAGQLRLLPIFTFTLCHGCSLSAHSLQHIVHIVLGVCLLVPASLRSAFIPWAGAAERSRSEPPACSLQLSAHPRAALLAASSACPSDQAASQTHLRDVSVSGPVTSLTRQYRGTHPPALLPCHIFILCPHLSPAAP